MAYSIKKQNHLIGEKNKQVLSHFKAKYPSLLSEINLRIISNI